MTRMVATVAEVMTLDCHRGRHWRCLRTSEFCTVRCLCPCHWGLDAKVVAR